MVNLRRHSGVVLFRVLLPNFGILFQQKYENYRTLQLLKIGSRHFYSVERFSNFTNWLVLLHVYNYISLLLFYCSYVYNHVQVRSYGGVCVWGGGGGDTPQKFYSKLQSAGLLFQSADKNIFDE